MASKNLAPCAIISCADNFEDGMNDDALEFAFNDPQYSDRLLQIEIIHDEYEKERLLRVKRIRVSSLVLASRSQFFLKLFSNGMKESYPDCPATIRIYAPEENAFMEILHFKYRKNLSSRTMKSSSALLGVMKLADKFHVVSCINQCVLSLLGLPMTRKLLCLDIPVRKEYQPLIDRAKSFLVSHYKDLSKSRNVLCNMTVAGMETILCSNEVWALSEDCVYDIVINWAKKQYPELNVRRAVLRSCITRRVRFPYLTCAKLREALACKDFDYEFARDAVDEALFFKADPQQCDRLLGILPVESFVERVYMKTIIFYDINLAKCKTLELGEALHSQTFYFGKQPFSLYIICDRHNPDSQYDSCGLFLRSMYKVLSSAIVVNCVFATKKMPKMEFEECGRTQATFTKADWCWGFSNPFLMPWETFIADDSPYFIDGVFHFRAEMSIQPKF